MSRSRLLIEVEALERGAGSRRGAARAASRALRAARRVAGRRPEVLMLDARRLALIGKHRAAERAWQRAYDEAGRLGMTPAQRRLEAMRSDGLT